MKLCSNDGNKNNLVMESGIYLSIETKRQHDGMRSKMNKTRKSKYIKLKPSKRKQPTRTHALTHRVGKKENGT